MLSSVMASLRKLSSDLQQQRRDDDYAGRKFFDARLIAFRGNALDGEILGLRADDPWHGGGLHARSGNAGGPSPRRRPDLARVV